MAKRTRGTTTHHKAVAYAIAVSALLAGACQAPTTPGDPSTSQAAAASPKATTTYANESYVGFVDVQDIVRDTSALGGPGAKYYTKYLDYTAPNGKPIRILAQSEVTDEQMLYTYSVLDFYLGNLPAEVASKMADNQATLVLPNGADRDGGTPQEALFGQNLHYAEIVNVGSAWYVGSDYEHRDATFEEVFHMVHDYGIGTTTSPQAYPELAGRIAAAQQNALPAKQDEWGKKGLWGLGSADWLKELSQEGSVEQEYIVAAIDSYYGLWEAYKEAPGGMWGMYVAGTRQEVKEKDPKGYEVVTSFLPTHINSWMRVDPAFEGTFQMSRDPAQPYTFKSQYLTRLVLTGSNNTGVQGNDQDNLLMGNAGENVIDGSTGTNTVQLRGASSEYTISKEGDTVTVKDSVPDRDGTDTLRNIQVLRFTDQDITP